MGRLLALAHDLFGDAGGGPAEPRRLLLAAWIRVGVVIPFVLVPTALGHVRFGMGSGRAASYWLAVAWLSQLGIIVAANAVMLRLGVGRPRALRALTYVSLCAELVSNQLSTTAIGNLASHGAAYLLLAVAIYRVFLDRTLGACVALFGGALFVAAVTLELAGVVPIAPYATIPLRHPAYDSMLAATLFCGSIIGALCFTFASVNYTMNEATRLHRYITESVLRRHLPPSLVERAARGELQLDAPHERRAVTVLFVARAGFAALAERLGAEAIAELLDEHLSAVVRMAHAHGATIDKFVGDTVMIVFGVPEAMEPAEQARRAVDLACAIAAAPLEIEGKLYDSRIGINSGDAVAGSFGTLVRSDVTVIGPTVNVAARLGTTCPPGRILLGVRTAELLGDDPRLAPAGDLHLKGVGGPTRAFFLGHAARIAG